MEPKPVVFIVGPTASGKSALGLELAKKINGEIICADSRTIYKGLDIATAKPSADEQAQVKHWCLDVVTPDKRYSAAQFKHDAQTAIKDIHKRGKVPIIVGGTGLYIDGLLFDYQFGPTANQKLRGELEQLTVQQLQQKLKDQNIPLPQNNKNKRYLIRAVEQGGVNTKHSQPMVGAIVIGLAPNKQILQKRIADRALVMLHNGAIAEAEWLYITYGYDAPATAAPFYKAFAAYAQGAALQQDCLQQFIKNDQHLAKRQMTWFKRNSHIVWFDAPEHAHDFVLSKISH